MTQAMYTAISGIRANQTSLNVISNNIANVNTLGFKSSNANFATIFENTISAGSAPTGLIGGTNPKQVGNGTYLSQISSNWAQGGTQYTGRNTDLMINGGGFFTVQRLNINNGNNSVGYYLTRAGNFTLDANGNLVTSSGDRVNGTGQVSGTSPNTLGLINIPLSFQITKDLNAAGTPIGVHLSANGTSAATLAAAQVAGTVTQSTAPNVELQSYTFGPTGAINATYSNGDTISVRVNPASPNNTELVYTASGVGTFSVSGADPNDKGLLNQVGATAVFDGGTGLAIGTGSNNGMDGRQLQMQIGSVTNPSGLLYDGNNNFLPGANSGAVQFGIGGVGSRGSINAGALESSNVDLAGEFTSMVITQRGIEAASKIITTENSVLQTITQMVQ